jgi:hypothetical protein
VISREELREFGTLMRDACAKAEGFPSYRGSDWEVNIDAVIDEFFRRRAAVQAPNTLTDRARD